MREVPLDEQILGPVHWRHRRTASTPAVVMAMFPRAGLFVGGLIVGALGRLLHPGPDSMGIGMTILIGIAANLIVGLLLHGSLGAILSFILAAIVAAALVALWSRHTLRGRRLGFFGRV